MASSADPFERAFNALLADVASAMHTEDVMSGKAGARAAKARARQASSPPAKANGARDNLDILKGVLRTCNKKRKLMGSDSKETPSDEEMSRLARFTDKFELLPYRNFLHFVPRIVNVVTLAEAIPVEGSGVKLPLDLRLISSRCKNSYYAPRRFSAVQLAYQEPRCRVLVFHTGRLVGTGSNGPVAARIALARAQRQLYEDAGIQIHVQNFAVINQVGAFSLRATLNCGAFADTHSSSAHFDPRSFVGLAWRPAGEHICCEIYSTGRANLPGSVVERQLQTSLSRMFPELLRFSSSSRLLDLVPDHLRDVHRVECSQSSSSSHTTSATDSAPSGDLWEDWQDAEEHPRTAASADSDDDVDLSMMGL